MTNCARLPASLPGATATGELAGGFVVRRKAFRGSLRSRSPSVGAVIMTDLAGSPVNVIWVETGI